MHAAILTICGVMTMGLTSCTENIDNPVTPVTPEPEPEQKLSKYTVEQIKNEVMGLSLDPVMYAYSDMMKLYDIDEDGQCAVYELSTVEVTEGAEEWDGESDPSLLDPGTTTEVVNVVQYEGTWTATNDISSVGFTDSLDLEGYDLMGALMLDTKMVFDEDDDTPTLMADEDGKPFEMQMRDTLAVLRDTEDGELFFINRYSVALIIMLNDMGLISDGTENAARRQTRAANSEAINQKIQDITQGETYRTLTGPMLDKTINMDDWMGVYYKGLNPRICDMSIPGAAAVPSAYIPDGPDPIVGALKRQFLNIEELWAKGVRYFDLGNCYYTMTRPLSFYDTEQKYFNPYLRFDLAIYRLKRLMEKHPTETVILMFEEQESDEKYANVAGYIYRMLYQQIGDRMLTNYGPDLRLNDCRGKFILMCHIEHPDKEYPLGLNLHNIWKAGFRQAKITFPNGKKSDFLVQSVREMDGWYKRSYVHNAFASAVRSAAKAEPLWVINNLSGYKLMDNNEKNYSYCASQINLSTLIEYQGRRNPKLGIVVMDFVGHEGRGINKNLEFPCYGNFAVSSVLLKNYYAVRDHAISLDEGDNAAVDYWRR